MKGVETVAFATPVVGEIINIQPGLGLTKPSTVLPTTQPSILPKAQPFLETTEEASIAAAAQPETIMTTTQ